MTLCENTLFPTSQSDGLNPSQKGAVNLLLFLPERTCTAYGVGWRLGLTRPPRAGDPAQGNAMGMLLGTPETFHTAKSEGLGHTLTRLAPLRCKWLAPLQDRPSAMVTGRWLTRAEVPSGDTRTRGMSHWVVPPPGNPGFPGSSLHPEVARLHPFGRWTPGSTGQKFPIWCVWNMVLYCLSVFFQGHAASLQILAGGKPALSGWSPEKLSHWPVRRSDGHSETRTGGQSQWGLS